MAAGMRPTSLQGRIYSVPLSEVDALHVSSHLHAPNTQKNTQLRESFFKFDGIAIMYIDF